jgi:hypothetical protein
MVFNATFNNISVISCRSVLLVGKNRSIPNEMLLDVSVLPKKKTLNTSNIRDCRGHDRIVVGFTTTCAISAYHH